MVYQEWPWRGGEVSQGAGKPPFSAPCFHVAGNSNNMVSNEVVTVTAGLCFPWPHCSPHGRYLLGGGTELGQHPVFPLLAGGSPPVGAPVLCSQHQEPEWSQQWSGCTEETTMDTSPGGETRQGCVLCPGMNLVWLNLSLGRKVWQQGLHRGKLEAAGPAQGDNEAWSLGHSDREKDGRGGDVRKNQ